MGDDQAASGQVALPAAAEGAGEEKKERFATETEKARCRFEPHHRRTGVKDWVHTRKEK